jgi:hypothetical protein
VEIAAENNSTTVFPIPMDLFGTIARGSAGAMTEEEVKRLEAASAEDLEALGAEGEEKVLPQEAETQLLAETAKSILGLGSGARKEKIPAEREEDEEE